MLTLILSKLPKGVELLSTRAICWAFDSTDQSRMHLSGKLSCVTMLCNRLRSSMVKPELELDEHTVVTVMLR